MESLGNIPLRKSRFNFICKAFDFTALLTTEMKMIMAMPSFLAPDAEGKILFSVVASYPVHYSVFRKPV